MTWRYQLTRQTVGEETQYAIREVYLDGDRVTGWTANPIRITGDRPEDITEMLMRIRTDMKRGGVLDIDAHPKGGNEK